MAIYIQATGQKKMSKDIAKVRRVLVHELSAALGLPHRYNRMMEKVYGAKVRNEILPLSYYSTLSNRICPLIITAALKRESEPDSYLIDFSWHQTDVAEFLWGFIDHFGSNFPDARARLTVLCPRGIQVLIFRDIRPS